MVKSYLPHCDGFCKRHEKKSGLFKLTRFLETTLSELEQDLKQSVEKLLHLESSPHKIVG